MDRIAKALYEHDEVFAEINDVLFGGGADELIAKLSEKEKRERTQARVGLASNAIGIAAGVAATPPAFKAAKKAVAEHKNYTATMKANPRLPGMKHIKSPPTPPIQRFKALPKSRKVVLALGVGGAGLQVTNLTGDLIANRVLNRAAKVKDEHVKKSNPDQADLHIVGGSLKVKAVKKAAPKVQEVTLKGSKKLHEEFVRKDDGDEILFEGEFSKVDTDKRQVFGYASVTKINGEDVVDRQGDHIDIEEVEKAAYDYMLKSRKGGDMHRRNGAEPHHVSDMIESFVITEEKIEKMGLPPETPLGWWVGFKINDDETWSEVKKGNRKGFSIHGRGSRVEKVLT